jgi:hypothetical protein
MNKYCCGFCGQPTDEHGLVVVGEAFQTIMKKKVVTKELADTGKIPWY